MIRTSMVEVMRQPFIRTAVLKGMSFRGVVAKHALRNALIAPFTVILLQLNYLVAGLVVVETVFAYPGFGRMMLEAALAKDIAVIEAGTLVAVFVTMLTQIFGDLGYMRARSEDPRMTETGRTVPDGTCRADAAESRVGSARARHAEARLGRPHRVSPVASLGAAILSVLDRLRACSRRGSRPIRRTSSTPMAARRSLTRPRRTGSASTMLGRDILSRIMWGARTVLTVAPIAVLSAPPSLGTLLGLLAGYRGGSIDAMIMRVGDIAARLPQDHSLPDHHREFRRIGVEHHPGDRIHGGTDHRAHRPRRDARRQEPRLRRRRPDARREHAATSCLSRSCPMRAGR